MSEHKTTYHPWRIKQEKIKLLIEKVDRHLKHIQTDNIIELKELIFAWAKQINDRIDISRRNPNRKRKYGWEMRVEGQIKKLCQTAKLPRKVKRTRN